MTKLKVNQTLNDRYLLKEAIGKGGFAEVFKAEDTQINNAEVAIKVLSPESGLSPAIRNSYINEFVTTLNLSHQYLLTPKHYGQVDDVCFIIMPLCKNGSMDNCVLESTNPKTQHKIAKILYHSKEEDAMIAEKEMAKVLLHTATSLDYLHSYGITHNDIKPGNILIADNGDYLLSDFGISSKTRLTAVKNSIDRSKIAATAQKANDALSVAYSATELFGDFPINTAKTDIFSLGVTLFEIATGTLPWMGQGGVLLNKGAAVPNLPAHFSEDFNTIVRRCMDSSFENRPTTTQLVDWTSHYLNTGSWDLTQFGSSSSKGKKLAFWNKSTNRWLVAANLVAVAAVGYLMLGNKNSDKNTTHASISAISESSPPTPTAVALTNTPSFPYLPSSPESDAVKKGIIELGPTSFNSYIISVDGKKNWKQEKADYGSSLIYDNLATFQDIQMGLKNYISRMLDYGVRAQNIHFVVSSGANEEPMVAKIKSELTKIGYFVNTISPDSEGKNALRSVLPEKYEKESFVVDLGDANTKISYLNGAETVASTASYGAKYLQKGSADGDVSAAIDNIVAKIPKSNTNICFIISDVFFELAKSHRVGTERYTVLRLPSEYTPEGDKQKGALSIYKAIAEKSGCKTFVFDWHANSSIGFLLGN